MYFISCLEECRSLLDNQKSETDVTNSGWPSQMPIVIDSAVICNTNGQYYCFYSTNS